MNILICDDEAQYIEDIEKNVKYYFMNKFQDVHFDCFDDAKDIMSNPPEKYDIAFLDIEMGEFNGITVARKLKSKNSRLVIFFITAYNNYLDDAMDLNAFRFLSKPLDVKRLFTGLEKALELIDNTVIEFMLKESGEINKIVASDIIYIEIIGHYTKVVSTKGEFISNNSIRYWLENLISTYFFHVHKSFIINTNYITKYNKDSVVLNNKYYVPIAYRKRSLFRQYFLRKIEEH